MIGVVEACNENVSNKGGENIVESKPEGRKIVRKLRMALLEDVESTL
jgi:hypothetical protein